MALLPFMSDQRPEKQAVLNPRQREAVEYCDGPLLVIAGPGTGKTHVITEKVLYLIERDHYPAQSILAPTFTEKAAGEMGDRIKARLAEAGIRGYPGVHTFHGFCFSLVQAHAERLGFRGPLRLLTGPLYIQFIKDHIDQLVTDHTDLVQRVVRFAKTLSDFTSRCHDEGLIGENLLPKVAEWIDTLPRAEQAPAWEVHDLAASMPQLLQVQYAHNVVTYGDLLTLALRLVRENEDLRRQLQKQYRYILVDELQDNNVVQFQLVNELAEPHGRILVVGDEDQCIYRFRGASLGLLDQFRRRWQAWGAGGGLKIVNLEENYRSTAAIIETFQALIQANRRSTPEKSLRPADGHAVPGAALVSLACLESDAAERRYLVGQVLHRLKEGSRKPGDIAILCRSLGHVKPLVADLRNAGIPVEVVGEGELFNNVVVRELLAWLKALENPEEEAVALHRLLRLQGFGLSYQDQRALGRAAQAEQTSAMALVQRLAANADFAVPGVSEKGLQRLRAFHAIFLQFQEDSKAQTRADLLLLIEVLIDFLGLRPRLNRNTPQGRQDLAAVTAFLQSAQKYEDHFPTPHLRGFVRYLDLLKEVGQDETLGAPSNDPETVKVMTVHQAKGREFPLVVIAGLSDRFPSGNSRDRHRKFLDFLTLQGEDHDQIHLEEERRVLYVALSRAQEELLLSLYAKRGEKPLDNPSPFPEEVKSSATLRVESIASESLPALAAAADRMRTRQAVEARLHYLISRLGMHLHGEQVKETMLEALRLFSGLLAERAGEHEIREILRNLHLPEELELEFLKPDVPAGVVGPLHLSASSLEMYDGCPRQYYYKHVVQIPESVGFEARLGTAIHRTLEEFHRRHPRADLDLLPELLNLFDMEVAGVEFQSEREKDQGMQRGRELLTLYLREEMERAGGLVRAEVEKEFTLRLDSEVFLRGKIDRLDELTDGRLRVVDYKSGKLATRPAYLDGFQMPIYALAVLEAFGRELESVEVIGLKELKELVKGTQLARWVLAWNGSDKFSLTPQRLQQLKEQIQQIAQGIRAGRFDPVPDEQRCGWCSYRLLCDHAWGTTN